MNTLQGESLAERLEQQDVRRVLAEHEVGLAYLFGSRLRGEADEKSDLDLAVLLPDSLPPVARLELGGRIERRVSSLLGLPTDVVVLNDAGPILRHEAAALGRPIYCPRAGADLELEGRVRVQYEDYCQAQRFWDSDRRKRLGMQPA